MDNKNSNTRNTRNTEIDLVEIGGVLLHWAWLILAVALVCGVIAYSFSKFVLPERYQSTTKVYVLNRSNDSMGDTLTYSELQAGSQLTKDYAEMITSRYVLEKVIGDLQLPYEYEALKSKVSVTTQPDTRIIQITVTDEDPSMAQTIARKVRIDSSVHIQNVMAIDAINVVDDANYPTRKSSPNNAKNAMTSALIGAGLVCAVLIGRHQLDDTIKTGEDVEKYLSVSCLAMIPMDESVSRNSFAWKRKRKRLFWRGKRR